MQSRTFVLRLLLLLILAVFAARLFYIQVIRHDYYSEQAFQTQVSKLTILPERGKVYALDGDKPVPLVLNQTVYTVFADPQEIENESAVRAAMQKIAGGEMVDGYEEFLSSDRLRYVVMARNVSQTQAEKLREMKLAGVGFQKSSRRVYPEGQLGAQMLGYVNSEGEGQYGLEGKMDTELKGKAGLLQTVTDVRQIPLTIGRDDASISAEDGQDMVLTIDRGIQQKAEEILRTGLERAKATKGSLLVMDPNTGRIMAMANLPTYDPAKYTEVEDYRQFQNGTVSDPYEVGSVMKVLSMGVGLDTGAVNVNSTFDNTGSVSVDGTIIKNVEEDPIYPGTSMTDVLEYSLNTGVVYVLEQMGGGNVNEKSRQTLHDYYVNRYRFGQNTGIEQAGEQPGIIIGPNEGQGRNVRYANMAFGQGMNITMIQTAAAFSAAMNGGTYYQPTLIQGTLDEKGEVQENAPKVVSSAVLSPPASNSLRQMTFEGRNKGFFGDKDPKGYIVGGKTGTSQIIDPNTGRYTDDNSIGSYLGFGGADKPEYVIMVRVEDSKLTTGYAGTVAAGPIFNDMSNWLIQYLRIPPKN